MEKMQCRSKLENILAINPNWYACRQKRGSDPEFVEVAGHEVRLVNFLTTFCYHDLERDHNIYIVEAMTGKDVGRSGRSFAATKKHALKYLEQHSENQWLAKVVRNIAETGLSPRYKDTTPVQLELFAEADR